jgi:hypothetical protein
LKNSLHSPTQRAFLTKKEQRNQPEKQVIEEREKEIKKKNCPLPPKTSLWLT